MSLLQDVEQEAAQVGKFARYVVAKRVGIVAAITVILNVLIAYHVITPNVSSEINGYIKDALDGLAVLAAVAYAQKGVTPSIDPRNAAGTPLIPVTRAEAVIANAVSELPAASAAAAQVAEVATPVVEEIAPADMSAEADAASAETPAAPTV